ncbi:chorismate mutase [Sporolactobacillus kofuensis]|uniref:Chorismate mutase n=1 Tax=Sporolactobacillus kofuensis TaxID=269672 RepID=A0ABW1WEQ5_9BACL|nr:chorismate mutase [Sporolactobacillus kofuensis]MCO7176674.1 chorismate mutase [Sporolactobacillus kofuensis]
MNEIQRYRQSIDSIDEQLSSLLNQRMVITRSIARYKTEHDCSVLDSQREKEILKKARQRCTTEELTPYHESFFTHVLALSRQYQQSIVTREHTK